MKVVYILNESQFYMRMAWFSLGTLRRFNPDIPVELVLVLDAGRENRNIGNLADLDLGIPRFTTSEFAKECASRFDVRIKLVENPELGEEAGYVSAQRKELWRVEGEDILLLDADTFVLNDISPLWDDDCKVDVTADLNEWGKAHGQIPGGYEAFNSGVVLFRGDTMQRYARALYKICVDLKNDVHPLGPWLGENRKGSREELAFSIWVKESGLSRRLWSKREVQTCSLENQTRILHTMTPNWLRYFVRFFKHGNFMPPRRLRRLLIPTS